MRNKGIWIGGTIAIIAICATVSYLVWWKPSTDDGSESIRIGYSRLRISLPVFVADQKGLFKKHGVNVKLEMYDTAQPMMQAMVEGKLDVAGYTTPLITYTGMIRTGKKLYFTTMMVEDQEHRISFLLRKRLPSGEKPTIQTIADLRGKKIGILPTVAYKAWLEAILKKNGVDPSQVTIQQVEPALQPGLLQNGGIDALFTNDPAATSAIAMKVAELITDHVEVPQVLGEPFLFASFNFSKSWVDANPEETRKIVAALDEAIIYINAHPKESKASMTPYLPEVFKAHVDLYPPARYLASWEGKESSFQESADQYRELGIISAKLDLTGLVYHGKPIQAKQRAKEQSWALR